MSKYIKKQIQELESWTPDLNMEFIQVSEKDKANGSPKQGDMIAFNPNDATDIWLVSEQCFKDNYELIEE